MPSLLAAGSCTKSMSKDKERFRTVAATGDVLARGMVGPKFACPSSEGVMGIPALHKRRSESKATTYTTMCTQSKRTIGVDALARVWRHDRKLGNETFVGFKNKMQTRRVIMHDLNLKVSPAGCLAT